MKICTYRRQTELGQFNRLGVFFNHSTIIDINFLWQAYYEFQGHYGAKEKANRLAPSKLSELLKINDNAISFLKDSVELFEEMTKKGYLSTADKAYFSFDLNDDKNVSLAAPLDSINCYRDFFVHEKHVKKGFEKRKEKVPEAWYEIPVYYKGPTSNFIGTDETILWPHYTEKLDYELELAAVIGKQGRNIDKEKANEYIFGFTILNDVSARDIQKKEMSVRLGPSKGKDFCSVIGPVIVTADEFEFQDPKLQMTASVNGNLWSKGNSGDAHYSWGEMISFLSQDEWVFPTDLLGSGTVGTGCGLELDKWIQPGDLLELTVDKIGTLKNIVGIPEKLA